MTFNTDFKGSRGTTHTAYAIRPTTIGDLLTLSLAPVPSLLVGFYYSIASRTVRIIAIDRVVPLN
jgi:hypothetical protein